LFHICFSTPETPCKIKGVKNYGWIPQDAPDVDRERIYFASNGDTISERDALALAEALTRALQKQPEPIRTHYIDFLNFCKRGAFQIE